MLVTKKDDIQKKERRRSEMIVRFLVIEVETPKG